MAQRGAPLGRAWGGGAVSAAAACCLQRGGGGGQLPHSHAQHAQPLCIQFIRHCKHFVVQAAAGRRGEGSGSP